MANRLASVWLGQCAAAGSAHFQLAKVIEPRRYPARALTRFARRRGRTRLLPVLAPHRVSRYRCEERVPLVLDPRFKDISGAMCVIFLHPIRAKYLEPRAPDDRGWGCGAKGTEKVNPHARSVRFCLIGPVNYLAYHYVPFVLIISLANACKVLSVRGGESGGPSTR